MDLLAQIIQPAATIKTPETIADVKPEHSQEAPPTEPKTEATAETREVSSIFDQPPIQDSPEPAKDEIKRPIGRPPGALNKTTLERLQEEAKPVNYEELSTMVFNLVTTTAATALGKEWLPQSSEESKMVIAPLAEYFRRNKAKDIPPGLLLGVVCVLYAAPRLRHDNTKAKLLRCWLWVKGLFGGKK